MFERFGAKTPPLIAGLAPFLRDRLDPTATAALRYCQFARILPVRET